MSYEMDIAPLGKRDLGYPGWRVQLQGEPDARVYLYTLDDVGYLELTYEAGSVRDLQHLACLLANAALDGAALALSAKCEAAVKLAFAKPLTTTAAARGTTPAQLPSYPKPATRKRKVAAK